MARSQGIGLLRGLAIVFVLLARTLAATFARGDGRIRGATLIRSPRPPQHALGPCVAGRSR